ncbi:MAG: hypothetical protein QN183_13340 [Armatimonadota bacterium]|nr:hypothetical protein [Armatimonadota bacterium]MDR7533616.1 hypothetical protein [Armatimonadota bacterium]MDR7537334.1 hypothetical protein [Armatimonadota bacterium]
MVLADHDRLAGSRLRQLLELRRRLRDEAVDLPRDVLREVLYAIEQTRRLRLGPHRSPWAAAQMSRGELLREIKWRLDVAALPELTAAARVLDRIRQVRRVGPRRLRDRRR